MVSYNKVILIGNLTKDPEIRYTPSGTPVANFRLAVNHRFKQGEEFREDVCFIDVVVFGKQAENCGQYLGKGNSVIVDGRLQERRWETEDKQKRSKHEIVAQTVRFFPKRADSGKQETRGTAGRDAGSEGSGWSPEAEGAPSYGEMDSAGGDVPF